MAGVHSGSSKWNTHKELVSRANHLSFLEPGKGLARMARPKEVKTKRQELEKQLVGLQNQISVAKVEERHASENKSKPTTGKK